MTVALAIILGWLALTTLVGVLAGVNRRFGLEEFMVGGRSFGTVLFYTIAAAEIYSAFAFLGLAGWSFQKGLSITYGLAYTAIAYSLLFFVGPRIQRLGRRAGYVTQPDFFEDRYGSRPLAMVTAVVGVVFIVPYLQLQLLGGGIIVQIASNGAMSREVAIIVATAALIVFVTVSGLRGIGWTNLLQALVMLAGMLTVGLLIPGRFYGGVSQAISALERLRADMDALPMDEVTDLPYRSVNPGRAHKCGHDGHTAILMGTAAVLANCRGRLDGNVRLLFQPAEEGVRGGGARVMVEEGVLDGVDEVYGLHSWPDWPKGELRAAAGPVMAQVHTFQIQVRGRGGHGSQPQACRDPVVAASYLVTSLQTVVSRGLGYQGGAVVSVCSFQAGSTNNVIPDDARLSGTIRTFDSSTSGRVLERLDELARGAAGAFGVEVDLAVEEGYPVLVNDSRCAETVATIGEQVLGPGSVSPRDLPMAGGEDFAYYAQQRPSAFFFLGAGVEGKLTPACHHKDFDFDDDLIPVGVELFLRIVVDRLAKKAHRPPAESNARGSEVV